MTTPSAPTTPRLKTLVEIYTRVAQGEKLAPMHLLNLMDEADRKAKGSGWTIVRHVIDALPAGRRASALYDVWMFGPEAGKPADLLDQAVATIRPGDDSASLLTAIAPHYAPQDRVPFDTARLRRLLAAVDRFPLHTRKSTAMTLESMYRSVPDAHAAITAWKTTLDQPTLKAKALSVADFQAQMGKLAL